MALHHHVGHFTLAIPLEETFILGLAFVAIGTGLLKPNISSIVGQLYADHDDAEIRLHHFLHVDQYWEHAGLLFAVTW